MNTRERGTRGEDIAASYLEDRGWTILARNERVGRRELDLIALRKGVLAFVEVKSRRGHRFGGPLEAITPKKQAEVLRAAAGWLRARDVPSGAVIRFDAIGVTWERGGGYTVRHVEDAWRPG